MHLIRVLDMSRHHGNEVNPSHGTSFTDCSNSQINYDMYPFKVVGTEYLEMVEEPKLVVHMQLKKNLSQSVK